MKQPSTRLPQPSPHPRLVRFSLPVLLALLLAVLAGVGSPLAAVKLAHASGTPNGWTPTNGPMNAARYLQTATLLPDGKVLVAGGEDSSFTPLSSAELYDPSSGAWTPTGSLNVARVAHTATMLPNGKVLVAGGEGSNGFALSSAELYDPGSGTWTATGSLNTARYGHTATLLPDGTVLVAGGHDNNSPTNSLSSAEFYGVPVPSLTVSGTNVSATEGSATSLVVATGSYSGTSSSLAASIDWGDGNSSMVSVTPAPDGSYSVAASHTYAEEGQDTIHIVVSDGNGQSAATTSSASVSDAALTLKQFAAGQVKELTVGLAALFTDADPAGQVSDYQATINWGDGTSSTAKVIKNPLGQGFVLAGLHRYASEGTYTVTLTVTDQGGSQLTKAAQVNVE